MTADYLIDDTTMSAIANQIRRISGDTSGMTAADALEVLSNVQGEVVEGSQYKVQAIDPFYWSADDRLKSGMYDEGTLFAAPIPKTYQDFTFDKWVAPIHVDGSLLKVEDYPVVMGAVYKPTSDELQIWVSTSNTTTMQFYALNLPRQVDWGDGVIEDYSSGASSLYYTHTYANPNKTYRIRCINPRQNDLYMRKLSEDDATLRSIHKVAFPSSMTTAYTNFLSPNMSCFITISDGVTRIADDSYGADRDDITGLTSIIIPPSVETVGIYAFYKCVDLRYVVLGYGVKTIRRYAFCYCNNLSTIALPNTITTIDDHAFSNSGLTEIIIPASVTSISESAFSDCVLNKVIWRSSADIPKYLIANAAPTSFIIEYDGRVLSYSGGLKTHTRIYVPDALVNTYKSTDGWSGNASYIYPLSQYNG